MNTKDTEKTDGTKATPEAGGEAAATPSAEEGTATATATQDGPTTHSDGDVSAAPDAAGASDAPDAADVTDASDEADEADEDLEEEAAAVAGSSGLLSAAAGVVAAGLGIVGLTGSWTGRVAAERETLLGQIETAEGGSTAERISALYGDAWHATALVNGMFALVALIVGLTVLTRPGKPGWVRAFGLGGAVLGGLGLLISIAMYFDLILSLPAAGS
ncbi:hypothetical protein ABZ348_21335 [Streptomyces sp. NPDC005963]|uniref:hypothetical protein n=1 Tax=Streptomyces sp. NPDC005963 TaxID=3156721 RepID=UPI0033EFACFB